ncbi:MAG: DUF4229 domain-containing protein [Streptosporangiaceae bacterium]|jgi:hypothetical protein
MRATLAYTAMRILLFIVALLLTYLAGARGLLLIAVALVISGVISYFLLSRQREAMSGSIVSSVRSFRTKLDAGTRAEDDD